MQNNGFENTIVSVRNHWRGYSNVKHLVVLYALQYPSTSVASH